MANTLTGRSGGLNYNGTRVARGREFQIGMTRDALEDTAVGDDARTYVVGLFGASGSATILIDPGDIGGKALINDIQSSTQNNVIELILNAATGSAIEATCLLTNSSIGVRVGDVQSASINFQVTGGVSGGV